MEYRLIKINTLSILDENLNNSFISGNKIRKIKAIVDTQQAINGILSIGSSYSSHILACAWWAKKLNIPFKGIIITDGKIQSEKYPHLKMAEKFGAGLVFTSNKDAYYTIDFWKQKLSNYLWIPGGAHTLEAANAYKVLFDKLFKEDDVMEQIESIILPYGTGTTAYGIWKSVLKNNQRIKVIGVSVSRDKERCFEAISKLEGLNDFQGLMIDDRFSGKYGEMDDITEKFRWQFFLETGLLPDPVYNAKSIRYFYEEKLKNALIVNTGGMLNNLL
jgi:1-aminocyclopropane-1-carboxylate deaminase/D-cysteine desulfhydrase-like pyridoxal-dependent ACC family enzyme